MKHTLPLRRMLNHIPGMRSAAGIVGERLLGHGFAQRRRQLMARYAEALGNRVRTGPFAGMLIMDGPDACGLMRLIGTYEPELHAVIEELLASNSYDTILNVGCAEGFYAVGLALRVPCARVYAFDTSEKRQQLCLQNAGQNGVAARVKVGGRCKCKDLTKLLAPSRRALVFMDCEGAEKDLMRPDLVGPGLLKADIVLECHDFLDNSITPAILERFSASHRVTRVEEQTHKLPDLPELHGLGGIDKAVAMFEARAVLMHWLVLRAAD